MTLDFFRGKQVSTCDIPPEFFHPHHSAADKEWSAARPLHYTWLGQPMRSHRAHRDRDFHICDIGSSPDSRNLKSKNWSGTLEMLGDTWWHVSRLVKDDPIIATVLCDGHQVISEVHCEAALGLCGSLWVSGSEFRTQRKYKPQTRRPSWDLCQWKCLQIQEFQKLKKVRTQKLTGSVHK